MIEKILYLFYRLRYLFLILFIVVILIDLFSLPNSKFGLSFLIITYIFINLSWGFESKMSILIGICYLGVCVLLLIFKNNTVADELSARAFVFLAYGITLSIIKIKKDDNKILKEEKKAK